MNAQRKLMDKQRIIFVGAFVEKPGVHGGQLAACTSLMRSNFAHAFDIILIDSTQAAIPPLPLWRRSFSAIRRLLNFAFQTVWRRPEAALIFLADGFSFAEKGFMALFAKAMGLRVVIAPRSGFLLDHYDRHPLLRRLIRRVFGKVDAIICQSQYWATRFVDMGADSSKCVVLKNWIDASAFATVRDVDSHDGPLRLSFLAWVERSKGIFDLLEAVAILQSRGRKIFLEVAGSGGDLAAAKARAQELGIAESVRFSGWLSGKEKQRLFAESDVFTMPSHAEGLPNAMLEAMAAGRPIVATTVGSIPDVLQDTKAGVLHAPGDIEALVAAIEFYDDYRSELEAAGARARAIALANHSMENASQTLQKCLCGI